MANSGTMLPPHFPVRPDWLARHDEPVLEPDRAIIDPHHHLWDRAGSRYFLHDYLEDVASGHDIRASVFIECGAMYRRDGPAELRAVGETEFAAGAAAMAASGTYSHALIAAGIVAHADLRLGDRVGAVLDAHTRAAGGRLRGIRQIAAWHENPAARGSIANPPPHLLMDEKFRAGLAVLERAGLSFDTFLYHTQIDELADLARAFPDLPIVANHIAGAIGIGPYTHRRGEVFADWRAALSRLAACDNAHIKLGGLGMRVFGHGFGERDAPPASEQLAEAWGPYFRAAIDIFGPDRCMFESNFPVDKGSCGYRVLWNAFKRIAAGASEAEKHAIFFATANRVYRLGLA